MGNPTRLAAALLRRCLALALMLAAADPALPAPTRALLADDLANPDAEPISRRRAAL
ncbi:hypothetical protein [Micromonospora sp. NPDC093277]|uniref:hypothetical protein n=1 Tax=Micromonospora sp. NPDC093277 TaxID=3364291 RepID=UPI00381990E1